LAAQQETGVTVRFYNQTLADFVRAGMPFPAFFPKELDKELFQGSLEAFLDRGRKERPGVQTDELRKEFAPVADPILARFPELREVQARVCSKA
jgi:hypothetical protein